LDSFDPLAKTHEIPELIRSKALELGFSACGFSPVTKLDEIKDYFSGWLDQGYHGEMEFLENNSQVRLDPSLLLENAQTVISLAASYHAGDSNPENPVSRYARGADYHKVLKKKGKELLAWINQTIGPAEGRVFVDSAPLFEKEYARRAGLGWIGKHGLLINPESGSYLFLCEIVTTLSVREEARLIPDHCGTCTRCIDACPTQALVAPYRLDPRKCISYLTIEKKGDLPETMKGKWTHTVYGCDICQEACPWNKDLPLTPMKELMPSVRIANLKMADIRSLTEEGFLKLFDGTPVKRGGFSQILRNFEFIQGKEITCEEQE
jgi:epoxyqueuosine reductase